MNATATAASVLPSRTPTRIKLPHASVAASKSEAPCFISRLIASLAWSFRLDAREQELARALLCKHSLGEIAKAQGVDARAAQQLCKALFATTGTDGREQLFEVALRLTMMRELSSLVAARA